MLYNVSFCCRTKWIRHTSPPSWTSLPHPTPLGHHRAPSWALCANNIFSELSILHMVVYICPHKKEWNWVICRDVDGPRPFIQSEVSQKEKDKYILMHKYGIFPSGSEGKESACSAGDPGLIPELGRSPGEENGNPLQYFCLENSMDRGALWTTVHGVLKSWAWLSEVNGI